MRNYFSECKTQEDVKRVYREMAKKLHPDNGGDAEEFKRLQSQYDEAAKRCWNFHETAEGETYEKESAQTPEEYREIIETLMRFENITVEVIGTWIWVTGDTYPIHEQLKEMHFFFSGPKKAWYNNGSETKGHRRGRYTMNQVRKKYGVSYKEESKGTAKLG